MDALAAVVLDFWFGPPPHTHRAAWFVKDVGFDDAIRARFGDAVAVALAGGYGDWCGTPHGSLARILLLDQFTRNIFRGTPQAFAGDERALATAEDAIARGFDRALDPFERRFCYLPFEHSEDAVMQERSLALFRALADATGDEDAYRWAEKHAAIIRRFGRYPHRNATLGRPSTPEEIAFLAQPGSSF